MSIAIIVPTYQEANTIAACLTHLQYQSSPFETIVADGGSTDDTLASVHRFSQTSSYPLKIIECPQQGRAAQMNWAAGTTAADILLFLHADSFLPPRGLDRIRHALQKSDIVGGRFTICLDRHDWPYAAIAWGINLRSRLTGLFTGDMGIFIRRKTFEQLGGYPSQPLLEDLELSRRMGRIGRTVFLQERAITSSRRWQKHGPWKTVALMQGIRAGYQLGISPQTLAHWYRNVR
ncbi:TIGR04283 family arsenosugar biosynthesis glycosyltransferase [Synechococcus sp. PCC 7336]|uniref:TIGR04283 family arsenosugar biosynthesis glycosyltransferase n=1 Tax=Synechococcus sp. PCC 7336 TaxID=195250 RepID=UPI00034CF6AC|nr:TIGR04283 family arsenosugar biosynthesis glycosyltransferase [Synechococcus sp. PCC 7336]